MTFIICLGVIAVACVVIAIKTYLLPERKEAKVVCGRQISDERKESL